jgi:hypothetical protein
MAQRITIDQNAKDRDGTRLSVFVATGSTQQPVACAADNDGWPLLCTVYAKQGAYKGAQGAFVDVVFDGVGNNGRGFAFNLEQLDATGPYTVYNRPG